MVAGTAEALDTVADALKLLSEYGVWDILTLASALSISYFLGIWQRRRVPGLSVYLTYTMGTGHPLYPNTLNIYVRNLRHAPILIFEPNFRFSKILKPGQLAHGNSATGDFEVKFRVLGGDGKPRESKSHVMEMLRHREEAFAYIPIDESLDQLRFSQLSRRGSLGRLYLQVVPFGSRRPRVVSMVIPIKGLVQGRGKPPLLYPESEGIHAASTRHSDS